MESSRLAPLVLRLARSNIQRRPRLPYANGASLSTSSRRRAAPLPPSPEEVAKVELAQPQTSQNASAPESETQPRVKRSLRPFLWASSFLLVGFTINAVMRAIIFPPPLPEPDSEEDLANISRLKSDLNNLSIVAELRKDRMAWREYDPYSPNEVLPGAESKETQLGEHMTAGSLHGFRGLPVQRSFYNAAEQREISVIFFGGAVSGWPGVVHGGCIMTVLKEAVERAANGPAFLSRGEYSSDAAHTPETARTGIQRLDCDSLTLTYKKPTNANYFYVVRAEVSTPPTERPGQTYVKVTLEDSITGQVKVIASGYCGVSGAGTSSVSDAAGGLWNSVAGLFGSTA